jgi:predicted NAD/FAD-binding protein
VKVAIVGSGVSGLVVAWLLARDHAITLYEADDRVGGHVHTHDLEQAGRRHRVDTGFIVFNRKNYQGFTRILDLLGVATQASSMSFSVQSQASGLEYNGTRLDTLFAQRRNLLRLSFWRMVREILRFNREARELLANAPGSGGADPTLGDYLRERRFSSELVHDYLVPMAASLWSTPAARITEFPARPFLRFFDNHGMLQVDGRPEWLVVAGGSQTYVDRITAGFRDRIRLRCPVARIERDRDGVTIASALGRERFDAIVLALHADQALGLLADPTPDERRILGALPYQANEAVLHHDTSLLPRSRRAWASWNYFAPREPRQRVTITYDQNLLQSIDAPERYLVTLNRTAEIDPRRVLRTMTYHHPVYTRAGFAAQAEWARISGVARTHYCGAYWGYGFHEDGVQSALRVARAFGRELA